MAQTRIRVHKNGPYQVSGEAEVMDFEGAAYPLEAGDFYLCRCGRSASKPFCDGTHKKAGFEALECVRMKSGT